MGEPEYVPSLEYLVELSNEGMKLIRITEIWSRGVDYWTFKFGADFINPPPKTYQTEPTDCTKVSNFPINEIRLCMYDSGRYFALYLIKLCGLLNGMTDTLVSVGNFDLVKFHRHTAVLELAKGERPVSVAVSVNDNRKQTTALSFLIYTL